MPEKVSDIKVWPVAKEGKLKANGSFVYDEKFRLKFTVWNGTNGLFVGFPNQLSDKKDDEGKSIRYPYISCIDKEWKEELATQLLSAFNEKANTMNQGEAAGPTDQTGGGLPF